jgi:hypothetical protein
VAEPDCEWAVAPGTNAVRDLTWKVILAALVGVMFVAVALFHFLDGQLSPIVSDSFVARDEAVTIALANTVEPFLVAKDFTSARAAMDPILSLPDVKWAYVTGPNGIKLLDSFIPQMPPDLKPRMPAGVDYAWIKLPNDHAPTLVIRKPVLVGIAGTV